MKRTLTSLILAVILIFTFALTVSAYDELPKVEEKEFSVASFHSIKNFLSDRAKPEAVKDSTAWLVENKDSFNLKYVSFLGQLTNGGAVKYGTHGTKSDELKAQCAVDEEWITEFESLKPSLKLLIEADIPSGITYSLQDTYAYGFMRTTNQSAIFPVMDIMPESVKYDYYDDSNYYSIVENNGTKYIIFQLELWPQENVLKWFNDTLNQHKDKYCIVFTASMIDAEGKMYTMWDWEETGGKVVANTPGINSAVRSYNMAHTGKPHDGQQIWKAAISKHDNILAVFSSFLTSDDIVMSKMANANGVETAFIGANISGGLDAENGAMPLITKFSEDNKTITSYYAVPEGTVKSKTITLEKIGTLAEPTTNDSLPHVAPQYNGTNKAYILGYEGNTFRPNANMTRAEACTIFARLILGTQTIPDGYKTRFTDVKESDWFYNAVAFLDETGFFFRNKNTTYNPNEPITRAEFVDLANSASSLKKGTKTIVFNDVPQDHFYYNSIIAAAGAGLVNGYEDETFRPDNTITRAEVVTVVNRLLGLKATEKTIATDKLDNEFVDIGTHWARLNILMASNSNVHGDYYYTKTLDGVKETATEITFENQHIAITIAKKAAKVTKIINKYTNQDINLPASNYQFIYLTSANGSNIAPTSAEIVNNRIKFTFRNGASVYMLVEIKDNYMTFEIDSELVSGGECITFANIQTALTMSDDDTSFRINAIGMTAWTNPVNKGYGKFTSTIAKTYPKYDAGTMGAKIGIAFGYKKDILGYLKEIMEAIDPSVGLTSTTGGAYAQDYAPNAGDYVIVSNINEENVPGIIEACLKYGIDQVDIHKGNSTHRPGDFYFYNTETGTAKEYYEKYGKQFAEAGLLTGLHTYAYYIDYKATGILSDPKWQKDLETLEEYTLKSDLTKSNRNVKTVESAKGFDMTYTFFYKNSRYILIDNEIILVGTPSDKGFLGCTRGCGGTTATEHKAGAKIKHLSGYFQLFTPVLGSDLFYHVADLTAQAYNDGGFGMIYLDAIDGLNRHTPEGHETWYYFQMFVQRITSQCKVSPIIETSSGAPSEWNVRGRSGAYDSPSRGYDKFNAGHIANNKTTMSYNMNTTLGWYSFYPSATTFKNTTTRTHFKNNFDFMGYQAVIYNMSIVVNGFNPAGIESNPLLKENLLYYKKYYSDVRKANYFTEEAKAKALASPYDCKIIEKNPGEYAFLEMYYNQSKVGGAVGGELNFTGNNPFKEQAPFIRIEQMFSTAGEALVKLAGFNENKTLSEQTLTANVSSAKVSANPTIKLRVQGTGNDGDAMLISLSGSGAASSAHADYFIDLNFEGWRDIIVAELDNGMYDSNKYKFAGITLAADYGTFVSSIALDAVKKFEIRLSGKTAGEARISGDVSLCKTIDAAVKNPSVTVGNQTITFKTTLKAGEYLEYDPTTNVATVYRVYDLAKEEVAFEGSIKNVANGVYNGSYAAEATTTAPTRAIVTLGFSGAEITN